MTERHLTRETFFKFFIPTLAASVTLSVLSMTDLVIAGHFVGETGLFAISLALPVTIFVQIVSALSGTGGAIVFSSSLGEGDLKTCGRIFTLSFLGALLAGLLAGTLGLIFLKPLIRFLGAARPEETEMASAYIGTLFAGMPFLILSPVMMTYLRNDSRQGYSMFCVVFCALFNLVFSLVFCIPLGMGIRGIAAATVLSQVLACILAGRVLFRKNKGYGFTRAFWSFPLFLSILKPGSTVALIFLCQVLLTVVVNRILVTAGGAAVYAVVKYLINFQFALFDGVTGAIQPMLGIYYGERERENIRETAACAFRTMMGISLLMFFVLEFGSAPICLLFGVKSPEVAEMTKTALRIIGISCFGSGAVTFLNAFYRCVGKEKLSFLLGLSDNLIFPLAGIFCYVKLLSFGTAGVFMGIGFCAFLTLLLWAFVCRPWKNGCLLLDAALFPEMEQDYHVIVPAIPSEMSRVMEQVEEYCFSMGVSMKTQYYISLSIEELILNVVGLAGEDGKGKRRKNGYYADIHIYPMEGKQIRLRIRDNLTEWTPSSVDISEINLLEETKAAGGQNELGLGIVKKIAREYSYKRTIGFNNFSVILQEE